MKAPSFLPGPSAPKVLLRNNFLDLDDFCYCSFHLPTCT
jgi:hypothetical protein